MVEVGVKRIVCVGGGHCNCQVLKLLKQLIPTTGQQAKLTLVNEAHASWYSGMLPGAVSKLYTKEDTQIDMEPLATWCKADYVQKRVKRVVANENRLEMEDGSTLDYDILALNVGSKTRDAQAVAGVWEHSLTTRPINDLLPKITAKEDEMLAAGTIPTVVICGAGAAGTELAFAFKVRWDKLFNADVKVTIVSATDTILHGSNPVVIEMTTRKLAEKGIKVVYNQKVTSIDASGVNLSDGTHLACNSPIWATGAQAQPVTADSDLEIMKGYFKVNDFMQSTSHPNVFAGGDCITMESYGAENFPPKAGVYAVRAGPFIAQNIIRYMKQEEMQPYVPQREFLSLMMTGDGKCIGTKFGMAWSGKWVWKMKDHIDGGFMRLFQPQYLFRDYATAGTTNPIENNELFEEENKDEKSSIAQMKERVATLDEETAARMFICDEDEEEFHERFLLIQRMNADAPFAAKVMERYALAIKE